MSRQYNSIGEKIPSRHVIVEYISILKKNPYVIPCITTPVDIYKGPPGRKIYLVVDLIFETQLDANIVFRNLSSMEITIIRSIQNPFILKVPIITALRFVNMSRTLPKTNLDKDDARDIRKEISRKTGIVDNFTVAISYPEEYYVGIPGVNVVNKFAQSLRNLSIYLDIDSMISLSAVCKESERTMLFVFKDQQMWKNKLEYEYGCSKDQLTNMNIRWSYVYGIFSSNYSINIQRYFFYDPRMLQILNDLGLLDHKSVCAYLNLSSNISPKNDSSDNIFMKNTHRGNDLRKNILSFGEWKVLAKWIIKNCNIDENDLINLVDQYSEAELQNYANMILYYKSFKGEIEMDYIQESDADIKSRNKSDIRASHYCCINPKSSIRDHLTPRTTIDSYSYNKMTIEKIRFGSDLLSFDPTFSMEIGINTCELLWT